MSKPQFWAIMYVLCNIVSNTEKTAHMEGQWGLYGLACSLACFWTIIKDDKKEVKE